MYEAGLGKVTSGTEKAPEAPAEYTETAAPDCENDIFAFKVRTLSSIHGRI